MKIKFTPDEPLTEEEELEMAKLQVVELTDAWPWLGKQINEEKLSWSQIFKLVAMNS